MDGGIVEAPAATTKLAIQCLGGERKERNSCKNGCRWHGRYENPGIVHVFEGFQRLLVCIAMHEDSATDRMDQNYTY